MIQNYRGKTHLSLFMQSENDSTTTLPRRNVFFRQAHSIMAAETEALDGVDVPGSNAAVLTINAEDVTHNNQTCF